MCCWTGSVYLVVSLPDLLRCGPGPMLCSRRRCSNSNSSFLACVRVHTCYRTGSVVGRSRLGQTVGAGTTSNHGFRRKCLTGSDVNDGFGSCRRFDTMHAYFSTALVSRPSAGCGCKSLSATEADDLPSCTRGRRVPSSLLIVRSACWCRIIHKPRRGHEARRASSRRKVRPLKSVHGHNHRCERLGVTSAA